MPLLLAVQNNRQTEQDIDLDGPSADAMLSVMPSRYSIAMKRLPSCSPIS